jgi:hypothetical protein
MFSGLRQRPNRHVLQEQSTIKVFRLMSSAIREERLDPFKYVANVHFFIHHRRVYPIAFNDSTVLFHLCISSSPSMHQRLYSRFSEFVSNVEVWFHCGLWTKFQLWATKPHNFWFTVFPFFKLNPWFPVKIWASIINLIFPDFDFRRQTPDQIGCTIFAWEW